MLWITTSFAVFSTTAVAQLDKIELETKLRSNKKVYFVDEPIELTLTITNKTKSELLVPNYVYGDYQLSLREIGNKKSMHSPDLMDAVRVDGLSRNVLKPGESRNFLLERDDPFDFKMSSIDKEGQWGIKYFFEDMPGLSSNEVVVRVNKQPLKFPKGTPDRIRKALQKMEYHGISSSRPGWTYVSRDESMKELIRIGNPAIPAILANIDNYQRQLPIIELCGALRIKAAVPKLLDELRMEDSARDSLIIAKLAEITKIEDGYGFHRRWFDEETRKEAVAKYLQWWKENRPGK